MHRPEGPPSGRCYVRRSPWKALGRRLQWKRQSLQTLTTESPAGHDRNPLDSLLDRSPALRSAGRRRPIQSGRSPGVATTESQGPGAEGPCRGARGLSRNWPASAPGATGWSGGFSLYEGRAKAEAFTPTSRSPSFFMGKHGHPAWGLSRIRFIPAVPQAGFVPRPFARSALGPLPFNSQTAIAGLLGKSLSPPEPVLRDAVCATGYGHHHFRWANECHHRQPAGLLLLERWPPSHRALERRLLLHA